MSGRNVTYFHYVSILDLHSHTLVSREISSGWAHEIGFDSLSEPLGKRLQIDSSCLYLLSYLAGSFREQSLHRIGDHSIMGMN